MTEMSPWGHLLARGGTEEAQEEGGGEEEIW